MESGISKRLKNRWSQWNWARRRRHEIPHIRAIREIRRDRYRWSRGSADGGRLTAAQSLWISCVSDALQGSLSVQPPRPDHARRAVDVNRPVTRWCAPAAVLAERLWNVTGGLTAPARLHCCSGQPFAATGVDLNSYPV
ncbi:MAG UNVERIFIED_CONTAM: hypothetical protein LVR18_10875 [Planctomycetaceae bacterium]